MRKTNNSFPFLGMPSLFFLLSVMCVKLSSSLSISGTIGGAEVNLVVNSSLIDRLEALTDKAAEISEEKLEHLFDASNKEEEEKEQEDLEVKKKRANRIKRQIALDPNSDAYAILKVS